MDTTSVFVSATCVMASTPVALVAVRGYRLYGGLRLVTCPETVEAAVVKINATRAVASKLAGRNNLRLRSCSRWPEKKGCNQACSAQLKAAPDGCRAPALPRRSRTPLPEASLSEGLVRAPKSDRRRHQTRS
jgi:hypothetical protein